MPEVVAQALGDFAAGLVCAIEGRADVLEELERSARMEARIWSKTSMGRPPGLAAVLSISGGTAPMRTALATRLGAVATDGAGDFASAHGVADEDGSLRSRRSMSWARSSAKVSMSLPCQGWLERPWPRRSWRCSGSRARRGRASGLEGVCAERPAVAEDDGWPVPQSL